MIERFDAETAETFAANPRRRRQSSGVAHGHADAERSLVRVPSLEILRDLASPDDAYDKDSRVLALSRFFAKWSIPFNRIWKFPSNNLSLIRLLLPTP